VLSEAQEVLQYAEAAQQAWKKALYQQWHSQVFEPIQVRQLCAAAGCCLGPTWCQPTSSRP
jgi:hypothetical protein